MNWVPALYPCEGTWVASHSLNGKMGFAGIVGYGKEYAVEVSRERSFGGTAAGLGVRVEECDGEGPEEVRGDGALPGPGAWVGRHDAYSLHFEVCVGLNSSSSNLITQQMNKSVSNLKS